MKKLIDFAKIQAAGNDFIAIDQDRFKLRNLPAVVIRKICDRHWGIGGDGILLVGQKKDHSITMRYFNADGSEGEMCGNGLRASVLFAYMLGNIRARESFIIHAKDGKHRARYDSADRIVVQVNAHNEVQPLSAKDLQLGKNEQVWGFIDTGVPHLVIETSRNLEAVNVLAEGEKLRNHLMFRDKGTNVNFVNVLPGNRLQVRTYERGVESETLSCGTGVTACALSFWKRYASDSNEIEIITRGGLLRVFKENNQYFLVGPAAVVFTGQYLIQG
jgi:diaminopimelate epimerase